MPLRLVVGLGNPGSRYAGTRHNAGFRLVEALLPEANAWKRWKDLGLYGEVRTETGRFYCARPMTFMNLSGRMVQSLSEYYRIAAGEILVCYDDFALPLGQLRIRMKGSSGGHLGMQSIVEALGTADIPRLRIGVGPLPPGRDAAQFVLEPVDRGTDAAISDAAKRAGEAVRLAAEIGLDAAMNRFNTGSPES